MDAADFSLLGGTSKYLHTRVMVHAETKASRHIQEAFDME